MLCRVNITAVSKAPHFFETSVFVSQVIWCNIPEDLTLKFVPLHFNVCSPSGSLRMIASNGVLNSLRHTKHAPLAITTKIALYFKSLHKVALCNWHISSPQVAMLVLLIVNNWKYTFLERILLISVSYWKPLIDANLIKLRTIIKLIFYVCVTVHHWYNYINSQLDATITNFNDNYNQLNMYRAIISPILRSTRLCLQLVA